MTGVTTTLEDISKHFATWHNDDEPSGQHTLIYSKISREVQQLTNQITNANNKNNTFIQALNNIINGTNGTNQIVNTSLNLSLLQSRIEAINNKIVIPSTYNTVQDYVNAVVQDHNAGVTEANNIVNDFLVQHDIDTRNDNLNNYTYTGIYRCFTTGIPSTLQNIPSGLNSPFILIVLSAYNSDKDTRANKNRIIRQILLRIHDGGSGQLEYNNERIYSRYYSSSTNQWGGWTELYGTHNTNQVSMKVQFSDNSTPQEYILLTKK